MNGRLSIVLVVAVVLVVGCEPQRTLAPRMEPLLADVPVPANFKYDSKRSTDFANQDASGQFNNYYYSGRSHFVDVVNFYKRYMPVEGWHLQQDEGADGRKKLFFTKGGSDPSKGATSSCRVTIYGQDAFATQIQITRMEK